MNYVYFATLLADATLFKFIWLQFEVVCKY